MKTVNSLDRKYVGEAFPSLSFFFFNELFSQQMLNPALLSHVVMSLPAGLQIFVVASMHFFREF